MKNTFKYFLILSLFLTLMQPAYACGICNRKILFNVIPIFIVFYILSFFYGLIAYVTMRQRKTFSFGKAFSLSLKLFCVWFLCGILTITFPSGPIPFLISTAYCFIVPNRYYKRLTGSNNKEEFYIKTKNILNKTKIIFLLAAMALGLFWQIFTIINISQNPDILKIHKTK